MLLQGLLRPLPWHHFRQLLPVSLVLRQLVLSTKRSFTQDVEDLIEVEALARPEKALVLDVRVDERRGVKTGEVCDVDVEACGEEEQCQHGKDSTILALGSKLHDGS